MSELTENRYPRRQEDISEIDRLRAENADLASRIRCYQEDQQVSSKAFTAHVEMLKEARQENERQVDLLKRMTNLANRGFYSQVRDMLNAALALESTNDKGPT